MKHIRSLTLVFIFLLCTVTGSWAAPITFTDVSATGSYHGGLDPLTDGVLPAEGTQWSKSSTWWNTTTPVFTFTFDESLIEEITLSVDNNDDYVIQYRNGDTDWATLVAIDADDGNVNAHNPGGQDTMSSDASLGDAIYMPTLDFSPVVATQIRIFAVGGDNSYSIGEVQLSGTPVTAAVPEPASLALLGVGLLGLAGYARRRF